MKQRDLLFAGLMLLAAPTFAQTGPGYTEPIFDPVKDAKVVFTQNFEKDWDKWSTEAVDTIWKVEYYKNTGTKNSNSLKPWDEPQNWQRGIFRDTTIYLTNGVVVCDNPSHKWAEKDATAGTIITDAGTEKQARYNALAAFGEADGGGNSYFKFTTDTAPTKYGSSDYSTSTNLAARYRRNLFVRGLDIEDNSSYRLTFYVKGKARQGHSDVSPYMVADVMRGYFHAEKPFSMGYLDDSKNYKYNTKIEYTKDFFNGEWEKCTFMTYYLNDTIANYYVFVDGYWWAEDSAWFWAKGYKGNNTGNDLYYHVQPDKFFVRLGFSSNYSEFYVDNMSLTKSTIGGVEYYEHMLRVNFGWETNLKDLAREAYAKTKIDAVAIPGDYFDVWGLSKITGQWEFTDIASAEYQGDGYMYMFTDTYTNKQGETVHYNFNDYSKILVSFRNPEDPALQLKYTGSVFPKATDIEWIKKGKIVENFYNEEAHLNPYVFTDVYSMYDRPPVLQSAQYDDGSFGLSGDIRELKFKFSREMAIDNPENVNLRDKCIVYVGEEVWDRTWSASDNMLVLTRPAKYTAPLSGDIEVEINNIYIPNTQRKSENQTLHYNFGAISRDLSAVELGKSFWDAKFYDTTVNTGGVELQPAGTAAQYSGGFEVGDGVNVKNAARLYFYDASTKYPRALCLSPRGSGSQPGRLFLGYGTGYEINLTNGSYIVKFDAASLNQNSKIELFYYPWVEDPRKVSSKDKTKFGEYQFTSSFAEDIRNNKGADDKKGTGDLTLDTLLSPMQFGFAVEKPGRYLVEIACTSPRAQSAYPGVMLSNIYLHNAPVSYNPIKGLNEAVVAAQARAALAAAAEKYAGAALTDLNAKIDLYKPEGSFTSTKPSDWSAATEATTKATEAMKLRMDTVDLVVKKAGEVADKLTSVAADNANWAGLIAYQTLQRTKGVYDSYPYSTKTNADLTAFIKQMDKEMASLDLRVKNTKTFAEAMRKAKALIDAKEQESYQQYSDLKDEYEDKVDFDSIGTTDVALADAYQELWTATHNYQYAVGILNVATRGIKELAAMASSLGSTIGDSAVVKDLYQNLKTDDDYLAAIYKAAIKAAIYEKGAAAGELDLSAFIKNYYLYATPIIADEMNVAMPETRDSLKYNVDRHGIANVGHTRHQYQNDGKLPIYTVLTQHPFTELIPGWTLVCGNGGGNDMLFLADMKNDSIYYDAVFDATLAMDWGGEADLTTYVLGLPAGEYTLGLDVHSFYDKYQKDWFGNKTPSAKGKGYLKVRPGGSLVEEKSVDLITGWLGEDSILVPIDTLPGQFTKKENDAKFDDTLFVSVDFTMPELSEEKEGLKIHALLATDQGGASFGDFKLTFKPSATFDYAGAVAAAKADVAKIITVVDINKAQNNNVEFYTLGGLKVDGAKSGQVLIRKTTGANGKVSFDKVLLK